MTPIIKRLELAEAALVKNGFKYVDDVWAAPAPATPAASVDTAEFVAAKDALIDAGVKSTISGASIDVQVYLAAEDHFIEVVSAHTARAVAAAVAPIRAALAYEQRQNAELEAALASAPQQHAQAALSDAIEAMGRAKKLPIWDNDVPHALHVELDIIFKAIVASHQPAAAPSECHAEAFSSRVCELGTRGCIAQHDAAPAQHSAFPSRDLAAEFAPASQQGGELPQDERAAFQQWLVAHGKSPDIAHHREEWEGFKAGILFAQRAASVPDAGLAQALKDIAESCNCCGDRADLAQIAQDALDALAAAAPQTTEKP